MFLKTGCPSTAVSSFSRQLLCLYRSSQKRCWIFGQRDCSETDMSLNWQGTFFSFCEACIFLQSAHPLLEVVVSHSHTSGASLLRPGTRVPSLCTFYSLSGVTTPGRHVHSQQWTQKILTDSANGIVKRLSTNGWGSVNRWLQTDFQVLGGFLI